MWRGQTMNFSLGKRYDFYIAGERFDIYPVKYFYDDFFGIKISIMKPSVSVWTTSQLRYDQRILRMIAAMESVGMEVVVWDRQTGQYPCGKIKGKWSSGPG